MATEEGGAGKVGNLETGSYKLVPVPPSPWVLRNHGVSGNFLLWSLIRKQLYQSIPE